MKVLGIKVEVQYTKALEDGSYKKVCFSADAQLEEGEDRREAHLGLYRAVAEDLKAAFSGNSRERLPKKDYPEPPIPKGTNTGKKGSPKPKTKMCAIHGVPMNLFTKNGGEWYSHNDETTGGEWCNGKKKR